MELRFIKIGQSTNRHKALLQGYAYTRQRPGNNLKWSEWFCDQRKEGCKGRLHIRPDEQEWREAGDHNHVPNFGRIKAMETKDRIKKRVLEQPNILPATITQAEVGRVDSETLLELPKEASMKKMAQRTRMETLPKLPLTLGDLEEVPQAYRNLQGEKWLLFDNGSDSSHRILVFGLQSTIRQMSTSSMWFGDGTFKSAPRLVRQLYTLHYSYHENVVLGLTVLMANRSKEAYVELFGAIRDLLPQQNRNGPSKFSVDFELAAVEAFTEVFPASAPAFCFFHFSQSLWRKAKKTGVGNAYRQADEDNLRCQFHALLGLAFVPPEHVARAFDDLQTACDDILEDVLDLLEKYYVLGKRRGRGRRPPRYPIESWNVNGRTQEGEPRTNNTVEGWNRRFNTLVGKVHPNIYIVIEELRKEELYCQSQRELIDLGNSPPKKKKKFMKNDDRLKRLVQRFEDILAEAEDVPLEVQDQQEPWKHRYLRFTRAVGHSARSVMDYLHDDDNDSETDSDE